MLRRLSLSLSLSLVLCVLAVSGCGYRHEPGTVPARHPANLARRAPRMPTPDAIAGGPAFWLKADAITTLADNDPVASWPDSSTGGRTATQATGGSRPTFHLAQLNSLPSVRFDGSDDSLDIANLALQYATVFSVHKKVGGTEGALLGGPSTGGVLDFGDGGLDWVTDSVWVGLTTTAESSAWKLATWRRASGQYDAWLNGAQSISGTAPDASTLNALKVGVRGSASHLNGDLAELIAYQSALSDVDRAAVEAYLTAKYFTGGGGGAPVPTILASDAGFRFTGRWGSEASGAELRTITNGALCEFAVAGASSVKLCLDTTNCTHYPIVTAWVDGVGPKPYTTDSTGLVTLAFPADYGTVPYTTHRVKFCANVDSEYPTAHDDWTDQRDAVRFLGIQATGGASLLTLSGPSDTMEIIGDSIVMASRAMYVSTDSVATSTPALSFGFVAAERLGLTPILNGHGGQGITVASTDGTPAANSAFGSVYAGKAWNPAVKPVIVAAYFGTNDTSFTTNQYQTYLGTIRAAYPLAVIFAVVPVGCGDGRLTSIQAAVNALTTAGDTRVYMLNYSALTPATSDGTHLTVGGHITLGTRLAADVRSRLDTLGIRFQSSTGGGGGGVGGVRRIPSIHRGR